ncbi:MAG TPA: histidine triad nucleotide-binding protein [Opitutae bacterium]|nr:histidine triad nucleotide-binding protein [Opitutaceae bacterium]HCR30441.1 histidine triad nucleotide-binding protein [Opitutae bacterium]|tara:strand:- start:1495 stop:1842 length:348 start_codon:yes stop_codon:yes gene_type:complete
MSSDKTLFQKIADREIPGNFEYEDDLCMAIHDIDPQAPTHILVIPKEAIPRIGEAAEFSGKLLGHLLLVASQVANKLKLNNGYRIVINNGPDGGEAVPHLHIHLLGGRKMTWPPG